MLFIANLLKNYDIMLLRSNPYKKSLSQVVLGSLLALVSSCTLLTTTSKSREKSEDLPKISSSAPQKIEIDFSEIVDTPRDIEFEILNSNGTDQVSLSCFKDGQKGWIYFDVNVVIPRCFSSIHTFSEGVALVSFEIEDEQIRYGFLNTIGQFIFPPILKSEQIIAYHSNIGDFDDNLYQFIEGRYPLKRESDGLIGFIDQTGEFVIEPQYHSVSGFHEGVSAVCQGAILDDRRGCGYINPNGDVLMPLNSSLISPFHNGIAWVKKLPSGSLQSVINQSFQRLTEHDQVDMVGNFDWQYARTEWSTNSGLVPARIPGCMHPPEPLPPEVDDNISDNGSFDDSIPEYTGPTVGTGTWGYLDVINGGFAIEPAFCSFDRSSSATYFIDDRAFVLTHPNDASISSRWRDRWAMIDPRGNIIDNYGDADLPIYVSDSAENVEYKSGYYRTRRDWEGFQEEGLLPVASASLNPDKLPRFGYIDREGRWAIPPQFASVNHFQEGLALVQDLETETHGFIDKSGNYVIPPTFVREKNNFEQSQGFTQGLAAMPDENGWWGYINRQGKMVIAPQFAKAEAFWKQGYAKVTLEDKTLNLIDRSGDLIFNQPVDEFVITEIARVDDEFIRVILEKEQEDQEQSVRLLMTASGEILPYDTRSPISEGLIPVTKPLPEAFIDALLN